MKTLELSSQTLTKTLNFLCLTLLVVTTENANAQTSFVVTNSNDTGSGSLRQAILDANGSVGPDSILFAIPTTDAGYNPATDSWTIQPQSALPAITDTLVIDGYSQPGASPNTNPFEQGLNTVLKIELDGTSVAADGLNIRSQGSGSVIRGLVINRFGRQGIFVQSGNNNLIEGNFIGTDVAGTQTFTRKMVSGVAVSSGDFNRIGGTTVAARNLISGNNTSGILISGTGSTGNLVQGNFIGTDVIGESPLPNRDGIQVNDAPGNTIGGTVSGAANLISGNSEDGVVIDDADDNFVRANLIGTQADGQSSLGNAQHGIFIQSNAAHNIIDQTNIIAFNGQDGVFVNSGRRNSIRSNRIFSNTGLGIDIAADGVTANDPGDSDTGANDEQNFPVVTVAEIIANEITIAGTLNSTANSNFVVEFFSNSVCEPSDHGEGETFLGVENVTTDANGDTDFDVTFTATVPAGHFITSTATNSDGSTSEFSQCVAVTDGNNTQEGENIVVQPEDETTGNSPVTLTFAEVTQAGNTTLATGSSGPTLPTGFGLGDPATYYDISTTAEFFGTVEVCIDYSSISFADENALQLFHFENNDWVDATTLLDTENDTICGEVSTLSPFTVLEPVDVCFTYDFLVEGGAWYLVSLPVIPANGALTTLFPEAVAAFDWDFGSQSYRPANVLEPERAYWVLLLETATAEVCGQAVHSYSNSYNDQGWDMIGAVVDTNELVDDPDNSVLAMFAWNPSTQSYLSVDPFSAAPQQGYWILVFGTPGTVALGEMSTSPSSKLGFTSGLSAFNHKYGEFPPVPPVQPAASPVQMVSEQFYLSENYPNPFNPETEIRFHVPRASHVAITIYNILGETIRELVNRKYDRGHYSLRWDGRDKFGHQVASGVYFYKLEAGSFLQIRKMSLLR